MVVTTSFPGMQARVYFQGQPRLKETDASGIEDFLLKGSLGTTDL